MQEDGNVALYGEGSQFCGWATNTGGHHDSTTQDDSSHARFLHSDVEMLGLVWLG